MPGEVMESEMAEQPAVVRRLLGRRREIVADLRSRLPTVTGGVALVARGSSDNAALFGRYTLEFAIRRPVAMVAPSLVTLYRVPTDYSGWVAVAISQSGETPEIVDALERLQERGAIGAAITNDPSSPLGRAARMVIPLGAGEERAVPATKTFMAQLVAFAFLTEAMGRAPWDEHDWERIPEVIQQVLDDRGPAQRAAEAIGYAAGIIAVGRGYLFGVALEAALKLKETCTILAHGYSAADLRHGPIAVVEHDFPVLVFTAPGPVEDDLSGLVEVLGGRGARMLRVGSSARCELPVPGDLPEALTALPATVRAQQVALALARLRGLDPDRPGGLSKVTRT
jgi:glutamine---fructose-6-phosphate transaminase (isomerizing)